MMKKKFFGDVHGKALIGLAVLFFAFLAGTIIWGIRFLAMNVGSAVGNKDISAGGIEFKIDDAKKVLRSRGLIQ